MCASRLTKKAEPPPTRDVNRDSGTDRANGGWLRRLVRRLNHVYHQKFYPANTSDANNKRLKAVPARKPSVQYPAIVGRLCNKRELVRCPSRQPASGIGNKR